MAVPTARSCTTCVRKRKGNGPPAVVTPVVTPGNVILPCRGDKNGCLESRHRLVKWQGRVPGQCERRGPLGIAVSSCNRLIAFHVYRCPRVLYSLSVRGLQPTERILGLSADGFTGIIYALGCESHLYTLDIFTGALTMIGDGAFTPALDGDAFGMGFDPVNRNLRVISNTGQNLILNPTTGAATAATPIPDDASIVGIAFTNNTATTPANTLAFTLQNVTEAPAGIHLNIQFPLDAGTQIPVGRLLPSLQSLAGGFDIVGGGPSCCDPPNVGFAIFNVAPDASALYEIDLLKPTVTCLGRVPASSTINAFTMLPICVLTPFLRCVYNERERLKEMAIFSEYVRRVSKEKGCGGGGGCGDAKCGGGCGQNKHGRGAREFCGCGDAKCGGGCGQNKHGRGAREFKWDDSNEYVYEGEGGEVVVGEVGVGRGGGGGSTNHLRSTKRPLLASSPSLSTPSSSVTPSPSRIHRYRPRILSSLPPPPSPRYGRPTSSRRGGSPHLLQKGPMRPSSSPFSGRYRYARDSPLR